MAIASIARQASSKLGVVMPIAQPVQPTRTLRQGAQQLLRARATQGIPVRESVCVCARACVCVCVCVCACVFAVID